MSSYPSYKINYGNGCPVMEYNPPCCPCPPLFYGPTGMMGRTGPCCTGPPNLGSTGFTGPTGLPGPSVNPTGPPEVGPTGPTGPSSSVETGPTGPTGIGLSSPGPTGPSGPNTPTGPTGPTGTRTQVIIDPLPLPYHQMPALPFSSEQDPLGGQSPIINPVTTWRPFYHIADSQSGPGDGPTPCYPSLGGLVPCARQPYRIHLSTCSLITNALSAFPPYPATFILASPVLSPGNTCEASNTFPVSNCDGLYAFVESISPSTDWRPIHYTVYCWTNVFGFFNPDVDGTLSSNVAIQGGSLSPSGSGVTGPTGTFFMPPHVIRFDFAATAEWLANSPDYFLTDGEIPAVCKMLLTTGNHTSPICPP